jgi:CheY-like chemotaxis protein
MARVLVVENRDASRHRLSVELLLQGYEVAATADVKEAFLLLEACPDISLVLVEKGTAGIDAAGLVRRLRAAHPEVHVALHDAVRLSTTRDHLAGWGAFSVAPPEERTLVSRLN